jgi:hypothetical protein
MRNKMKTAPNKDILGPLSTEEALDNNRTLRTNPSLEKIDEES